ncbi:hypothetical protein CAEBREN_06635 [Caenorhabditis brenneri]|uniref:F-box domain-containing protein n=1 Tax=Caenorhabditis brenneri TaxID=135651 RepID=G0NSK4_CAEBE|nr:hypothetical protein CAEBREN_06635 [Caenorhabditis brenneri]
MGVPILKLPIVALKILLDYMDGVELVTVSLLSKRADRFLTACGQTYVSFFDLEVYHLSTIKMARLFLLEVSRRGIPWPGGVSVSISGYSCVSVNQEEPADIFDPRFSGSIYVESRKKMKKKGTCLKIGETDVPVKVVGGKVYLLWDTKMSGLISLLKYFHQDLNILFNCLTMKKRSKDFSKNIREFLNHINSTGISPKDVEICHGQQLSNKDFKFLLENVSVTGTFNSSTRPTASFKFRGKIQAESISIKSGYWFRAKNLMTCVDCKEISVLGSWFTRDQVKLFLESWKSGNFPNLQKVKLETSMRDAFYVTDDFERRSLYVRGQGMSMNLSRGIVGYGTKYGVVTKQDIANVFEMSVESGDP